MLEVAKHFPDYEFVVAKAPGQEDEFYTTMLQPYQNVSSVRNETYKLLLQSTAALVTSGTATLETALFAVPEGITIDAAGNLYVSDLGNNRIRKITPAGTVSTVAGGAPGFANGAGPNARFNAPSDITIDAAGNLYVMDVNNHIIRKIKY